MKHSYRGSYSIFFVSFFAVMYFAAVFPAFAEPVLLPVPPLSQHLSFADSNGDTGYYDCAIAAEAMALQALSAEGKIPLESNAVSYTSVRLAIRAQYANIGKGITLREAAATIPGLTNNTLGAAFIKINQRHWEKELYRQLQAGYPVIAHISDWSYLDGHSGEGKAAHSIVITGMDDSAVYYVDPWDGKYHGMSHVSFAAAWAQGNYNWSALVFIEKNAPRNFTDLMRLLAVKHTS